jgi:hypothetical protein
MIRTKAYQASPQTVHWRGTPVSRSCMDGITRVSLQSLLDEGSLIVMIEGGFISPLQLPRKWVGERIGPC